MATIVLGNESVIEEVKKDEALDASPENVDHVPRKDLGRRETTMDLNETDGDDNPSRAMNFTLATRFWGRHSDKPPAWVDGTDELLVALLADHYGCPIGRPKNWTKGK